MADIAQIRSWFVDPQQLGSTEPPHGHPAAFVDLMHCPTDIQLKYTPSYPLIGVGSTSHPLAASLDAIVEAPVSVDALTRQISAAPNAAATAVQLLRSLQQLPADRSLTLESMCYGMLQGSAEHITWLNCSTDRANSASPGRLIVDRRGTALHVILDRASAHNAIDVAMRDQLVEVFTLATLDRDIERVCVSALGTAFSIGGDLEEFGTTRDPTTAHLIRSRSLPAAAIVRCPARLEVHVQGACIGAGIEMSAFASRLTADGGAWFQLPELAMGLIPGAGGCVSLPARIGRQRTALMILSGKRIDAATALRWGLIDAIQPSPSDSPVATTTPR